ncbi:MAG: DUF3301 domain-containing protein [Gammaproteobacteria bacterium]|nr:DUF3301 domain-containing protein [Gammaproteobacteria bacterium]
MDEILIILLILAGIWYWWDTQQCSEIVLLACQKKCADAGLQLLDSTVCRQRTWVRRGPAGGLQLCRLYSFEYTSNLSSDYNKREYGYIVLIGKQVVETNMPQQDSERLVH